MGEVIVGTFGGPSERGREFLNEMVAAEARDRFLRRRIAKGFSLSDPATCNLAMGHADPELQEFTAAAGYVAPPDDCA